MVEIEKVVDKAKITYLEDEVIKEIVVNCGKIPAEKNCLGKKVGDTIFKSSGKKCVIIKIEAEELPPPPGPWPKPPERTPFPAYT